MHILVLGGRCIFWCSEEDAFLVAGRALHLLVLGERCIFRCRKLDALLGAGWVMHLLVQGDALLGARRAMPLLGAGRISYCTGKTGGYIIGSSSTICLT